MMTDMKWTLGKNKTKKTRGGFTLIEVLVVISLIGILSGILYTSFGPAKDTTRNKALQTALKETQLALELYKAQNGEYPAPLSTGNIDCEVDGGTAVAKSIECGTDNIIPTLIPDFIAELPKRGDSGNANCNISYKTDASHTWYKLTAENCAAGVTGTTGVQAGDEFARCLASCPSGCTAAYIGSEAFFESYAVYSNGGECE